MAHLTHLLSLRSVLTSSVFMLVLLVEMSPTRATPFPTAFPTGNPRPTKIQLLSDLFPADSPIPTTDEVTNCPLREAVLEDGPENKVSTCPWVYKNHHDADRYPSNIDQAECLSCESCLDRNGEAQDADMVCRQVMYRMRVLMRRHSEDGLYTYDLDWYDVPVACTCTRPPTSPSGNRPTTSQPVKRPPGL